jgi:hypothetical protein
MSIIQLCFFPLQTQNGSSKTLVEATTTASVNISSLILKRLYPIVHANRINTKYGPTVLLSIRDVDENVVDIFLPKRYANVVTDEDLENINSRSVYLNLVYKGLCESSNSYLLAIDS